MNHNLPGGVASLLINCALEIAPLLKCIFTSSGNTVIQKSDHNVNGLCLWLAISRRPVS